MDKEELIEQAADVLRRLYYDDVELILGFLRRYEQKKGMTVPGAGE